MARYERYTQIDPKNMFQRQGYDYLIDEKDLELTLVPSDRDFLPRNDPAACSAISHQ